MQLHHDFRARVETRVEGATLTRGLTLAASSLTGLANRLILVGLLIHLLLAVCTGLTPDEAHYALYGAHLGWSYFDHPPLTGWLQAPFVLAGGTDLLMRVLPMASWLGAVLMMRTLCRRLSAARGATGDTLATEDLWVACLMLLSPLLNLLGVVLVPDSLLLPLVPAAMLMTWTLRDATASPQWRHWIALGLILGLCLLAKYTGLFVVLGALLSLVAFRGRALWRLPGFWLAAIEIVLLSSPIFIWNAAHHWISFAYQADHAQGSQSWTALAVARALALQLLLFGILLSVGVIRACRGEAQEADEYRAARRDSRIMGLLFGLPVLLVFLALAGRGSSLPHWTTCGWTALIPLAIAGIRQMARGFIISALTWQIALMTVIVGVVIAGGVQSETGAASTSSAGTRPIGVHPNPAADLYGWQLAAVRGATIARESHARGLVVMNWSLASRLAWYARPLPVFVAPKREDQFELWFGALRPGASAVVVDWSGMPLPVPIGREGFGSCEPVDRMPTIWQGRQLAHFNFLLCRGWATERQNAPLPLVKASTGRGY